MSPKPIDPEFEDEAHEASRSLDRLETQESRGLVSLSMLLDLAEASRKATVEREERRETAQQTRRNLIVVHTGRLKRLQASGALLASVLAGVAVAVESLGSGGPEFLHWGYIASIPFIALGAILLVFGCFFFMTYTVTILPRIVRSDSQLRLKRQPTSIRQRRRLLLALGLLYLGCIVASGGLLGAGRTGGPASARDVAFLLLLEASLLLGATVWWTRERANAIARAIDIAGDNLSDRGTLVDLLREIAEAAGAEPPWTRDELVGAVRAWSKPRPTGLGIIRLADVW